MLLYKKRKKQRLEGQKIINESVMSIGKTGNHKQNLSKSRRITKEGRGESETGLRRSIMERTLSGEWTYLIPMTVLDLEDQLADPARTAARYGLKGALEVPDEHMAKILEIKLAKMKEVPDQAVFSTYFLIVALEGHEILGTIGFKGAPDEDGTIEVGYGIRPGFREKGYMTDALRTFTEFGLSLPGVSKIVACTSKDNAASIRVLEKVSYKCIYTGSDLYVWRFPAKAQDQEEDDGHAKSEA